MNSNQPDRATWTRGATSTIALTLASLLIALALLTSVREPSPPPVQAARTVSTTSQTPTRCSAFLAYGDHAWYKAQQQFYAIVGLVYVGGPLDGDLDGYACENLAKGTAAVNEPGCFRRASAFWLVKDCNARTRFRIVTHLTSRQDATAYRAALLDIYMPYAAVNAGVADDLLQALSCPSSNATQTMQDFIRTEQVRDRTLSAFTGMLGLGDKALREKRKTDGSPLNYITYTDYAKVFQRYLDLAAEVAGWSTGVQMGANARANLQAIATDKCGEE